MQGALVRVGELLADKYEVTRILGQGGMGVVVAARHRELDKLVALKFMHEEVAANELAIDRFLREARAAARLQNEHVGRVLDVGRLPSGVPYIVMEFLEGRDLADVLKDRGTLTVSDACEYLLQICEAMTEAHTAGIVHRDLKPQNLFLTMRPDGRPLVKVLDFGISKVEFAHGATATQQTMGTPAYMAPEQMRSARSADARADIWSLGVILYQLLSGALPFVGETVTETMLKVMTDDPPSLAQITANLPASLVATVERCLRKNRDERFENVTELAHELTPFVPDRARAAMSLIERVMSAGVAHAMPPATVSSTTTAPKSDARLLETTLGSAASVMSLGPAKPVTRRRWTLGIGVALLTTLGVVWIAWRGAPAAGDHDVPAATQPPTLGSSVSPVPPERAKPPPPVVKAEPIAPAPSAPAPIVEPEPSVPSVTPKTVHEPWPRPAVGKRAPASPKPSTGASPIPANTGSGSASPRRPVGEEPRPRKPVGT